MAAAQHALNLDDVNQFVRDEKEGLLPEGLLPAGLVVFDVHADIRRSRARRHRECVRAPKASDTWQTRVERDAREIELGIKGFVAVHQTGG